jgi:predicted nucleic acid-binding protein
LTLYVVDASVAAKWFVAEEHSGAARALLSSDHERLAPELMLIEAAHVFAKRQRRREMTADEARVSLLSLRQFVRIQETASLIDEALDVALLYQRSAYDGLYVALAIRERCQLVTADRPLFDAIERTLPGTMLWIEDVPTAGA